MGKIYHPNIGETTKIITSRIKANLGNKPKRKKHKRIENFKYGKFKNSDLKYLIKGIEILQNIGDTGLDAVLRNLNSNNEELEPETVKLMTLLRIGKGPLYDFLSMYKNNMRLKFDTEREIANLKNMYEIVQNSRDGIITRKQMIKTKDENGQEREMEIDISMSEGEIADIVKNYERQLYYIQDKKFSTYLGLGMSLVSIVGAIYSESKNSRSTAKALGISSIISVGTLLGRRYITKDYNEKVGKKRRDIRRLEEDLVVNEPISNIEEEEKLNKIEDRVYRTSDEETKIQDKVNLMKAIDIISMSLLTGVIGIEKLKKAERFDAKTISQILIEINQNSNLVRSIMNNIDTMYKFQKENEILEEYEKEMENIVGQIEEKQDPLIEVQKPFEKLEIKDFRGKFYQEKNPDTGEIRYRNEIAVPEFSIEKGQVVLLSGRSGIGKSTLFKLILGELTPTSGSIVAVDKDGQKHKIIRNQIGYISQEPVLMPASIIDNITMFNPNMKKKALNIIDKVKLKKDILNFKDGINTIVTTDKSNISGGQKQKIVLARTLLYNKPLILVDEATSAIDARNAKEILRTVTKVDATVIVIAHNLTNDTRRLFDKEIKLSDQNV